MTNHCQIMEDHNHTAIATAMAPWHTAQVWLLALSHVSNTCRRRDDMLIMLTSSTFRLHGWKHARLPQLVLRSIRAYGEAMCMWPGSVLCTRWQSRWCARGRGLVQGCGHGHGQGSLADLLQGQNEGGVVAPDFDFSIAWLEACAFAATCFT